MKGIALLSACVFLLAAPAAAGVSCEIAFCHFEVPDHVKDGNFNFYVIYAMELDQMGKPSVITKLRNAYVPEGKVQSCLNGWRFQGFDEGAVISVSFRWTHAVGWDRLVINGPGFVQKVLLTGERVPYRPVEERENGGCKRTTSDDSGDS